MTIEHYKHLLDGKTGAFLRELPEGNVAVLQGDVPNDITNENDAALSRLLNSGIVRVVFSKTACLGGKGFYAYNPNFSYCSDLKEFLVDPENPDFYAADGMLFRYQAEMIRGAPGDGPEGGASVVMPVRRKSTLLCCPPAKEGICTVPEGVVRIDGAFRNCVKLTQIRLPESVRKACPWDFASCPAAVYAPGLPWSEVHQQMKQSLILGWACAAEDGLTPPEERLAEYQKYLKANRKRLYPLALEHMPLLQRMFEAKVIPYKEIQPLVEEAGDNATVKTALLDYMNRNFDVNAERAKIEKREEKVFSQVMETGQLPPSELNKLWSVKMGKRRQAGIARYNGDVPVSLKVPEVLRKSKVTAIESWAFHNCETLKEIVLPKGLKKIGVGAFGGCTALTGIDLPRSLKEIESNAFYGCAGLTEIVVPNSVKELGWYAFENCSSLTDAALPKNLDNIGVGVFAGCTALKNVMLPETAESIGTSAFAKCTSLTGVTFPEGVQRIGGGAFMNCTGLTGVTLPEGAVYIGPAAFANCTSLTAVTIPESMETIGPDAFLDCKNLREVSLPKALMPEVNCVFRGTPWLKAMGDYVIFDGMLCAYQGSEPEAVIPEGVTQISRFAFYGRKDVRRIVLPGSLVELSDFLCVGGNLLTGESLKAELVMQEGLQSIGPGAFLDNTHITEIALPDSVVKIGEEAFKGCKNLKSVRLPKNLQEIGKGAFADCPMLTRLDLPEGVKRLGAEAFKGCVALTWLSIPDSVKKLPKTLFRHAPSVVLHVPAGSPAEQFAKENRIRYVAEE